MRSIEYAQLRTGVPGGSITNRGFFEFVAALRDRRDAVNIFELPCELGVLQARMLELRQPRTIRTGGSRRRPRNDASVSPRDFLVEQTSALRELDSLRMRRDRRRKLRALLWSVRLYNLAGECFPKLASSPMTA